MGLIKYPHTPSPRSVLSNAYLTFKDVCILEHNTSGHTLFNVGDYYKDHLIPRTDGVYSSSIKELDLILGDSSSLNNPISEIIDAGYKNIFLCPTSIGEVIGTDYEYLSDSLMNEFPELNIFSIKCTFNGSFKDGESLFYESLIHHLDKFKYQDELESKKNTISILGGRNTYLNHKKHEMIEKKLKNDLGLETVFSIYNKDNTLLSLRHILESEIVIYTSLSSKPFISFLEREYNKKTYYMSSLDEDSYISDLKSIYELLDKPLKDDVKSSYDESYTKIINIFSNILNATKDEFKYILYLDEDNLEMFRKLFKYLDIDDLDITYYLNHPSINLDDTYISNEEFIDRIIKNNKTSEKEVIYISSDIISKYAKHNIEVEFYNSTYHLLTPIDYPIFLEEGLYSFIKDVSRILL